MPKSGFGRVLHGESSFTSQTETFIDRGSMKQMRRIVLANDIEVVISSYGGVGTTFLMEYLSKYKKINDSRDYDRLKHSPIPPISFNKKVKFVYIYGNPELAVISLFRRKYHSDQSEKLLAYTGNKNERIPLEMTLDEYASLGIDRFLLSEHFHNWYEKYLVHPTFFVKYEKIPEAKDKLLEFLELPEDSYSNFPKFEKRKSTLSEISIETQENLKRLYGDFSDKLNKMDDFEIRLPKSSSVSIFSYLHLPYLKAVKAHLCTNVEAKTEKHKTLHRLLFKPKA